MPNLHCSFNSPDADYVAKNREMHGQIPIFSGNKLGFQCWNTAFTSHMEFKKLSLKACLAGEAANTIKGL